MLTSGWPSSFGSPDGQLLDLFSLGFYRLQKGWRSPAIIRASFPAEVWLYLLCFQNLRRSHAGFIRAHQWKSRNGQNSPEFRSAKSVRESARVQAGGLSRTRAKPHREEPESRMSQNKRHPNAPPGREIDGLRQQSV